MEVNVLRQEHIKFKRAMEIKATKHQIREQRIYPGYEYEDTLESLEWWLKKLTDLQDKEEKGD